MSSLNVRTFPTEVQISPDRCVFAIGSKIYPVRAITFRKAQRYSRRIQSYDTFPPVVLGAFEICKPFIPYYIDSDNWSGYFIYDEVGTLFWSPTEKLDPTGWILLRRGKPASSNDVHFSEFGDLTITSISNDLDSRPLAEIVYNYSPDDFSGEISEAIQN